MDGLNLIAVQSIFFEAFLELKDYDNAEKIIKLTKKISSYLSKREAVSLTVELYSFLYQNAMMIKFLSMKGKSTEALQILNSTENRIKENKEKLKDEYPPFEDFINELRVDYLILFSSHEQALKLLNSTKSNRMVSHYDKMHSETKKADLLFKKEDYKSAYDVLKESLAFHEKEFTTITNEMDELLYAHSEAEQNRLELKSAERVKSRRLNWIIG